tara:strand:+ start:348 stop:902 length:555 start_codon:yes stop_codon:yes gene_type:complete
MDNNKKIGRFLKANAAATVGGLLSGPVGWLAGAYLSQTKKGKRFWDTTFGRSGLIGEGGEMLGLWKSGSTADRESGMINAINKDIKNTEINNQTRKDFALNRVNQISRLEQQKTGGIIQSNNYAQSNTATDSSRGMKNNQAIQSAINKVNVNYTDTIVKNMERDAQTSDRIMALDTRKETIRRS